MSGTTRRRRPCCAPACSSAPARGHVPAASHITGTPRGTAAAHFLKAELTFASSDEMMAALTSEAGMAVSRDATGMTQRFGCQAEIMLAEDL